MMKIIKKLQKDVQIHLEDNERLKKAKWKQEDFNMKLMQSLEIIEKKWNKESESNKSGSHGSHDEEIRERSCNIHHQHSQRNSKRRPHSSSSPSPTRKHRISEADELKGEMNKINPPTFYGEHHKDEEAETWLFRIRKYFQLHNYSCHA
jgi:hypothetical protein